MSFFKSLPVRTKIYSLVSVCAIAMIFNGVMSYRTLNSSKVGGYSYDKIVQGKDLIADILPPPNYIIETHFMTLDMANKVDAGADAASLRASVERCRALQAEFDDRHAHWLQDLDEGEMKRIKTVDCYEPAMAYYKVLNEQFIPACLAGDQERVKELSRGVMQQHYETHRDSIDKVVAMATAAASRGESEAADYVATALTLLTTFLMGSVAAVGLFGWYTARETVNPLRGSATRLKFLSNNDLSDVSARLRENAESTSDQATMASGAAEEVSANAQSLATAVEQFEASIREIAGNASNAANVAREAVDAADETNTTIQRLGESSAEIGNVIKAINSIAEQTNLLALNATIEAARAGEAGKGFAVVANEVKELAKETSKATEDIVGRIESIQSGTSAAVNAIGRVSHIIAQINESQEAIAGAVEEQTAMTSEISRNISEVAIGSGEIARSISMVAETASHTTRGSDDTQATAADIDHMATELMKLVGEARNVAGSNDNQQSNSNEGTPAGKYKLPSADHSIAK